MAVAGLTDAQAATLKTFILADGTLGPKATSGDYDFVANALNADASPAYWAWKTRVGKNDLCCTVGPEGTTWNWSAYIARSQAERDAWRELFSATGFIDASQANVRSAFTDIFSGASNNAPEQRAHCSAVARRKATVAEKVLASGTGSTASPATFGWQGTVSVFDVNAILNS